ncbi:MAG: hypothetical protein ACLR0U_29915 [Enterocloster clostridioformis]
MSSYPDTAHPGQFTGAFVASAKVLYHKLDFAFSILSEILTRSKLDDEKRLGEILDETRSRARMKMPEWMLSTVRRLAGASVLFLRDQLPLMISRA